MAETGAIERGGTTARTTPWAVIALPHVAAIEVAMMASLILSYTWIWQRTFKGAFLVCVLFYFLIAIGSHRRRGETRRDIGFRLDNLRQALGLISIAILPIAVVALAIGAWMQTYSFPEAWKWPIMLAYGSLWGMLQQYGLLAFFYRRLIEVVPGEWGPAVAAAGLFSVFHFPNPFLMIVTLVGGIPACWVYRRAPNLLAVGIAHGTMSMVLHRSMPMDVTFGMRVGPGFYRILERMQDSALAQLLMTGGPTVILKRSIQCVAALAVIGAVLSSVGPAGLPDDKSIVLRRYLGRFLAWPYETAVERPFAIDRNTIADPRLAARLDTMVERSAAQLEWIHPDPADSNGRPPVGVLHLKGRPWEMGWVYGRVLQDQVRANVTENMMPVVRMLAWPRQLNHAFGNVEPFIPNAYADEMRGISAGSGVQLSLLKQMHAVPEISEQMCSGMAFDAGVMADGLSYHVRLLDYATYLKVQAHPLIVFYQPLDEDGEPDGNAYVNVAWAGFHWSVGGINERGLAIGEIGGGRADAIAGERPDGEPMGVLVRRVLNEADDIHEAESVIATARRNLRYVYVLSDKDDQAIILSGPELYRVNPAGETLEKLGERYDELPGFDGIAWHGANHDTHVERFTAKSSGLTVDDILEHNKAVALKKSLHAWVLTRGGCDGERCETLELRVANAVDTYERAVDQPYVRIDLNEHFAKLRGL